MKKICGDVAFYDKYRFGDVPAHHLEYEDRRGVEQLGSSLGS
jgi:hypothetical protein